MRLAGDADPIRRRDEILQALYWMRGEGFGDRVGVDELRRILAATDADRLADDLRALAAMGLVRMNDDRAALTEEGVREGGRRFAEEFAGLTGQAHGACEDPDCDCQQSGPEACRHAKVPGR